jgi:hypothetical protein
MKIAIVDSGIDINHKRLKNCKINGITIKGKGNESEIIEGYSDIVGHGTGIAAIINKVIPDVELFAIKIFDQSLFTSERVLIDALKYCQKKDIKIINLSLGILTTNPSQELIEICRKLYQENVIIVSASSYILKDKSFPAFLDEVFGVTGGHIKSNDTYGHIPNYPIEFIAKGSLQRVAYSNNGFKITDGPSYACAYFTGIIANTLKEYPELGISIDILKKHLINNADPSVTPLQFIAGSNNQLSIVKGDSEHFISMLLNHEDRFKWVGKMALFPSSEKEMQAFFKFPDLVRFPLVKYFDYPKSLKNNNTNITKPQDTLPGDSDFEEFDTLVLGYFHEHLFQANVKYGFDLLHEAIKHNKNIFVFDKSLKNYIDEYIKDKNYSGKIYLPHINGNIYVRFKYFEHFKPTKTPVLCFIGTGSKTGKFTSQLKIKQLLKNQGYTVSHLSTEPQGELFGSVFSFPYGYNETIELDKQNWSPFIRSFIKAVEYFNKPHLLITGSQGWSFPPIVNFEPSGSEFDTLNFIFGVQPDAVICAINPNDSIEFIKQHTHYLNLFTRAKIIFYTITPWINKIDNEDKIYNTIECLDKVQLNEKIAFFNKNLDAPVIDVMDFKNNTYITEAIENFFTQEEN